MLKYFVFFLILPIGYLLLFFLLKMDLLNHQSRLVIAEYGASIILIQAVITIVLMLVLKNQIKYYSIITLLGFIVLFFKTILYFNPV